MNRVFERDQVLLKFMAAYCGWNVEEWYVQNMSIVPVMISPLNILYFKNGIKLKEPTVLEQKYPRKNSKISSSVSNPQYIKLKYKAP